MRTDGTVTQPRLKQVALSAISEVNAELYEFRRRQQMLGYASLAEVPAEQLDGNRINRKASQFAITFDCDMWCIQSN